MPISPEQGAVIIPDSGRELLRHELTKAFITLGFNVIRPNPAHLNEESHAHYLPRLLERGPALFFSVNMQGILRPGSAGPLLLAAGIPVLIWLVDNPWHILSGARDPSWRGFNLALTDHSFDAALKKAGAGRVLHLPLAAGMREQSAPPLTNTAPPRSILFVGRAAFPGRDDFFKDQKVPEETLTQAKEQITQGFQNQEERPDFAWWLRRLRLEETPLWPGKTARRPGLGAALSNARWRAACLVAAHKSPGGLSLFGGDDWKNELPLNHSWDLHGPLDYYTSLPHLYRAAVFSLNLNSLILPAGLSQRAFDIWAAGGFCLTDWSAGLDIFPTELTREVVFHSPDELADLAARLQAAPARKEELRQAWQQHILSRHTYLSRLKSLLETLP
ncbi:MAG: glycosyltransferase [Deltaproteobacteria bacterium]|jgi:hypothetical protein|nr:glycosyltransferase [Deltaproteobacteria bacterium]